MVSVLRDDRTPTLPAFLCKQLPVVVCMCNVTVRNGEHTECELESFESWLLGMQLLLCGMKVLFVLPVGCHNGGGLHGQCEY